MSAPENYHRIGSSIWTEYGTDDERLMAFYILTNPHRTTEGYFVLKFGYMHEDLDWTPARTKRTFNAVAKSGLFYYDDDLKVCLIREALNWQAPTNEKQMQGAVRRINVIPVGALDSEFQAGARRNAPAFADYLTTSLPSRFPSTHLSTVRSTDTSRDRSGDVAA